MAKRERGEGSVYRDKKHGVFYASYKDREGKWKKKSTGSEMKRAALRKLEEFMEEEATAPRPPAYLDKFLAAYLDQREAEVGAGAWARYGYCLKRLVGSGSPLASLEVGAVDVALVSDYVSYHLKVAKKPTVLKEIVFLKMALTDATDRGLLSEEALRKIRERIGPKKLPALHKASKPRERVLHPQEMQDLLAAVSSPAPSTNEVNENLRDAIGVALLTGLRQENILELRVGQIDFACTPSVIRYAPERMKNEKGHLVRLHPIAREILWRLCSCNGGPERRVFHDFRPAWKRLQKRLAKAGLLEGFRFHDLRRTYTSYRLAAGVDVKQVQRELGHEDSRMTLDVYGQALDPASRAYAREHFRFDLEPEDAGGHKIEGPRFPDFFPTSPPALVSGGG